jgi:hypothetical protein
MSKRGLMASAAALVCACSATPTAPTPPPQPFHQAIVGTVDAGRANMRPLTAPRSGTMTIALTWPERNVDLHLYLASAVCDPGQCRILDLAAGPNGNSRRLTRTVANGETFQVIVNNLLSQSTAHYTVDIDIR